MSTEAPRTPRTQGGRTRRRGFAPIPLLGGAFAGGMIALFHDVPPAWTRVELPFELPSADDPLGALLSYALQWVPLGLTSARTEALAVALVMVVALLAGATAGRLLRGPGQVGVQLVTPSLVIATLLPRLEIEPASTVAARLAACVPALVVCAWPRGASSSRLSADRWAVLAASSGLLADLHHGLVAWGLAIGVVLSRPLEGPTDRSPTPWPRVLPALVPAAVAVAAATLVRPTTWHWPSVGLASGLRDEALSAPILIVGVATLALLGLTLRHHRAAVLLLMIVLGQGLTLGGVPSVPPMISTVVLAIASAASIWWLAGLGSRNGVQATLAGIGTAALLALMLSAIPWRATAIADGRSTKSLLRVYDRGLIAPGDSVFAFGTWRPIAERAATYEGWRPDIQMTDATRQDPGEFLNLTLHWDAAGRRVLSDSFDAGGHWDPSWVVDSGPLFWFVGRGNISDPEFTDLARFEPAFVDVEPVARRAWVDLEIERARFRRAVGEVEAALYALPLAPARRRGLLTRLQLARTIRPTPATASELNVDRDPLAAPRARVAAECADLLYAHGEPARGTELFLEAAEYGSSSAMAALARWQVRAGQESEAQATLGWLAADRGAREQALALGQWLLDRKRRADTRTLLRGLRDTPATAASDEIGLRLRLLQATED